MGQPVNVRVTGASASSANGAMAGMIGASVAGAVSMGLPGRVDVRPDNCANCKYFLQTSIDAGQCRRYPPGPLMGISVGVTYWCGDFVLRS